MPRPKEYKSRTTFTSSAESDIYAKFQDIARREGRGINVLLQEFMEKYIKEHGSGNPAYSLEKWQDDSDFKVTPAYLEKNEKWDSYMDKCNRAELSQIEGKALYLREGARTRWLAKRE